MINTADDPVRRDPTVARIRAMLAERDPEVLAAIDDVDRTLIVSELRRDLLERVRTSVTTAVFLDRWARCKQTPSRR